MNSNRMLCGCSIIRLAFHLRKYSVTGRFLWSEQPVQQISPKKGSDDVRKICDFWVGSTFTFIGHFATEFSKSLHWLSFFFLVG